MMQPPPLTISELDADRLETLLDQLSFAQQQQLAFLRSELERAQIVAPEQMPATVVTMNSTVRFIAGTEEHCLTLVYPKDQQSGQAQLSVLSAAGSALLGLKEGDQIIRPMPDAEPLQIRVLEVLYQPEREGIFYR